MSELFKQGLEKLKSVQVGFNRIADATKGDKFRFETVVPAATAFNAEDGIAYRLIETTSKKSYDVTLAGFASFSIALDDMSEDDIKKLVWTDDLRASAKVVTLQELILGDLELTEDHQFEIVGRVKITNQHATGEDGKKLPRLRNNCYIGYVEYLEEMDNINDQKLSADQASQKRNIARTTLYKSGVQSKEMYNEDANILYTNVYKIKK